MKSFLTFLSASTCALAITAVPSAPAFAQTQPQQAAPDAAPVAGEA